ncbi:MAG TPA: glycosyltransferase family 4 protein [Panacibacter sp.]|nr:glycosyltransferase family 4 protein [Panacibacter sp.]
MNNRYAVLLFGPELQNKKAFYGSGTGGYTRNMSVYLQTFISNEFELVPCYHSVRVSGKLQFLSFPFRLLKDIYAFIKSVQLYKPSIIHILGQYRSATPREYFIVLISKLFRKKIVYEIKAGVFIEFFRSANPVYKYMIGYILNQSSVILVEGEVYIDFIRNRYPQKKVFWFPNFVPYEELPPKLKPKLTGELLSVLFAGYCYEGKGVYELVKGLNLAAEKGIKINLTLIGKESPDFKNWLNNFSANANLQINRMGVMPHQLVLQCMREQDIYLYPSRHPGEGHNNSINEAMMNNMVIVSSKIGFLTSVLADGAYFLKQVDMNEIAMVIDHISTHKKEALEKAAKANKRLADRYTSKIQIPALVKYYKDAISEK